MKLKTSQNQSIKSRKSSKKNVLILEQYDNIEQYNIFNTFLVVSLFTIIAFIANFLFSTNLNAQFKASPMENIMQIQQKADNSAISSLQQDAFPVGNVINSEVYLVGPSDILSIQMLPADMAPQVVTVTAECSIIHPRYGEISVKGLTLQQVRDSLTAISNRKKEKEGSKVVVSLLQARKVFVTVRGNVVSPGTYTLPATYSVSTVIKFANHSQITAGLNIDEQSALVRLQEARKEREKIFADAGVSENAIFSTRNIRLIRNNGKASIVDIERAKATDDATFDPFISEGDEIIVPFEEAIFSTVSIAGAVFRPVSIAYKTGDLVSHLIKMGYGFTENADLDNINFYSGDNSETKKLTVDTFGNLVGEDFELSAGSKIIVGRKEQKSSSNFGIVAVKGEVNKPNIYIIEKGVTQLKDVIEMAGGFTNSADLKLASVGRRDNNQNERVSFRRKYSEYFQKSDLTMQDTMRLSMEIELNFPKVACDFVSVFEDNSEEYNVFLQDGDVIQVPQKPNRVNVFGQVNKPGFIDFQENQTMEWYIMKAGGYSAGAAQNRARIIRGNNRVWEDGFEEEVYVNDGDEIFVPSPRDVPPEMELQILAIYAGLVGVVLSIIGLGWNIYRDNRNLNN